MFGKFTKHTHVDNTEKFKYVGTTDNFKYLGSRYLDAQNNDITDEIIEVATIADAPEIGNIFSIYIDISTGKCYRWNSGKYREMKKCKIGDGEKPYNYLPYYLINAVQTIYDLPKVGKSTDLYYVEEGFVIYSWVDDHYVLLSGIQLDNALLQKHHI